jgi:hypothetical protein
MATIRQLEQALLAADAAGDTESAQILAMEIQKMMAPPAVEAPKAKPKTGFMPALRSGIENLKGDVYAGLAGLGVEGSEAKARAQKEKAAALYQQPEFLEHPVDYVTGLLGQSIPYMAAPLAAGAAFSPIGALAATGAAGAASATQFTMSNLARQLDEGKTGAQLETGKAFAAALPQAALDVIGFRFIPGIRTMFGKAGIPITEEAAKGIAGRYILPAAKTAGVEGVTEAGQQVFERLQAGLNITDPEARKEYFDSFLGGAVLGGTLSIPGTMLEGRRKPEQAVAPETTPPNAPPPSDETPPPPTLVAPEQLALAGPEKVPQLGYTPQPPQVAPQGPQPNVIDLMDQYATAQPRMEALEDQITAAMSARDTAKAKDLFMQLESERDSLTGLKTQIEKLGGVAQTADEFAKSSAASMGALDKELKAAQKAWDDAKELGDFGKIPKLAEKLEKLQAERDELQATQARHNELLRIQGTPKGETIALFAADEVQPKSTKVLEAGAGPLPPTEEEKSRGKVDEKTVAAKEAEAEKQAIELEKLVKTGPKESTQEQKNAAMAEVNAARAKLTELKAASQSAGAGALDEELASANIQLKQAMDNLQAVGKRETTPRHITEVNRSSEKLNKLYDEIDALRGGKPLPTETPMALFERGNLLRTAIANDDKKTVDILTRAQKEADQRAQRGMTEEDKRTERMQQRLDLPGTVVERVVDDEEYDSIMDKIEVQLNKINKKQGNAKESYTQKAERLLKEMDTFEAAAENEEATAHQRAMARRTYNAKLKEYETIVNGHIKPAQKEMEALYKQLYTKKEVGSATEIAEAKQKETERAGRSEREVSKEVKRAKKLEEGKGIKAAPERVAREIGQETEAYQKLATAQQKKVDAKVAQYNAFVKKAKDQLAKIKEKKGDVSDAYKAKEAEFVTAANQKLKELNEFKQNIASALDAKAEELGRAAPEMRSKLLKATKDRKKAAAESTQEVASKRTLQETRKVAKLGTMTTGTPESQARSAAKQAVFEDKVIKPEEQARVEKAVKDVNKAPSEAKGSAMKTAFTKAAQKTAKKETPKAAIASEVESPDLTEKEIKLLEDQKIPAAFDSIVDNPNNSDLNRAVAAALSVMLDNTRVVIHDRLYAPDGKEILGQAVSTKIDLSRNGGLNQETLLHEGVHSAVERVIQMAKEDITQLGKEQQVAYKELRAIYERCKNDPSITSKNAKSDISEFAAEVMSNSKLQEQLRAKPWRMSNMFRGFVSAILRAIGVKNVDNMLNTSVAAIEALMQPTSVANERVVEETETPRYAPKDVGVQEDKPGVFSFKSARQEASIAPSFVAKNPTEVDRLRANFLGLAGRVQFVDKDAALSEALKKGVDSSQITPLEAEQGEYYLRFGQQRSQYAGQFLTSGPVSLVGQETERGKKIGKKEFIYQSTPGANMMQVADALAPSKIGNDTEKEAMLTALLAGERAKQVGWAKLNFENPAKVEQEYNQVNALLNSRPQDKAMFDKAMEIYKQYNNGLLDFLVQTGTMTEKKAAELKKITYVPFYRVNKGTGEIELMVDKEHPVRIGNIKDEPQLKELVGDSTQILPVFTSAVQNTFMLTDMALRNQMVKENAFILNKIGIASTIGQGAGPAGPDTVRFKHKGEDHFVVIDTDLYGIPASLIVKGMEGIKTTIPAAVRMLGVPADILRKFVTRNPAYAIKQAIRDPLTAWMTTGADGIPVLNGLKELSSMVAGRSDVEKKLMASGAISSNVFTGDKGDIEKFLKEISMGRTGWQKIMARADAFALQGDAATRAVIYRDSLNKGMSEMQAMLRTLESMNFSRRGLSPSMQMASILIPFFNAQIQGLDVLYRAFKGDMPYSQQLEIRKKMMARGLLLAAGTIAYAAMMEDDEAYKNAKPEERLGNWFLPTPFSDEPLRIPVPFELGYLFKSLPEAVYNMAAADERNSDITKGMSKLVMQSNPFSLPQAIKPLTEVYLGKSFFGGDIESQREIHGMVPTERYRTSTTEIAKMMGSITGEANISPIKLDYLIRGYTGGLGIALISLANPLLNTETTETPSKKTSQLPFIGGLFQPIEGRGTLDAAYARMLEIQQAKGTYDSLLQRGKKEEAAEFREEYIDKISSASVSGSVQQKLGEIAKMKRMVTSAPNLSTERKDELLKRLETQQNNLAERFLQISDRTTRQAAQT